MDMTEIPSFTFRIATEAIRWSDRNLSAMVNPAGSSAAVFMRLPELSL
jgi:hypothetical protein